MSIRRAASARRLVPIRNVIISVSDKSGLDELVRGLLEVNPELRIYSTGGTFRAIAGILAPNSPNLIEIASYTGQPEMEGGLVKSLDFRIHAGILAEAENREHDNYLEAIGAIPFDMVVVNLYPFEQTVSRAGSDLEDARGNIDIGGPTMLRGGAKNFLRVAAVSSPGEYGEILRELKTQGGSLSLERRFLLARAAFARTAGYEQRIADYIASRDLEELNITYPVKLEDERG
ncbi:MAG: hypothetical protein ACLFP6_07110 [Spirochaetaceae bacterium]